MRLMSVSTSCGGCRPILEHSAASAGQVVDEQRDQQHQQRTEGDRDQYEQIAHGVDLLGADHRDERGGATGWMQGARQMHDRDRGRDR